MLSCCPECCCPSPAGTGSCARQRGGDNAGKRREAGGLHTKQVPESASPLSNRKGRKSQHSHDIGRRYIRNPGVPHGREYSVHLHILPLRKPDISSGGIGHTPLQKFSSNNPSTGLSPGRLDRPNVELFSFQGVDRTTLSSISGDCTLERPSIRRGRFTVERLTCSVFAQHHNPCISRYHPPSSTPPGVLLKLQPAPHPAAGASGP